MKPLIAICMLFTAMNLAAQNDSTRFEIKDYKYRNDKFQMLHFDLSSSGGISDNAPQPGSPETKRKQFGIYSIVSYNRLVSRNNRFTEHSFQLYPQFHTSKTKTPTDLYKEIYMSGRFLWHGKSQFFSATNWFAEIGNTLDLNGYRATSSINQSETKFSSSKFTDQFFVGFGKGRIELIKDAQLALFLLQDLQRNGLITAGYSSEQVLKLSQLITQLNNRRIFDSRKMRMYELQQLDSFLKSSGLANTTDIRHFTVINDNWAFAFNPDRRSGTQWYIRAKGFVGFENDKRHIDLPSFSEHYSLYFLLGPEIGIDYYKPLSLYWQFNMGASVFHAKGKTDREIGWTGPVQTINQDQRSSSGTAHISLSYLPNTRTLITSTLGVNGLEQKNMSSGNLYSYLDIYSNLSANYFLGFRTRLNAEINFRKVNESITSSVDKIEYNRQNIHISLGLSHFIL